MHTPRGAFLVACAALLLTSAACSSDDVAGPTQTHQVRLYGSDGNMYNGFGDEFKDQPGLLAGMTGTTPLTPLATDFKNRLLSVDPKLSDFIYTAESYDAVVISTLAAELAGTTNPRQIGRHINGVTTGGRPCETVAACLTLARAGTDLQYRGMSLRRGGFTDVGEPAAASYGTLHFDRSDRLDDAKTEFVGAGDEGATTKKRAPRSTPSEQRDDDDGSPLTIGGLLPKTGDNSGTYAPHSAGVRLAIKEINAAGGALGDPVKWIDGDDGTSPPKAKQTVARHVAAGVDVIIGSSSSRVSTAVLPDVVAAGLVMFSPSNTAAELTKADDRGLYFRTAPSDLLQAKALTDVIMRDGIQKIVIVARKDAYGVGLMENVRTELEKVGIAGALVQTIVYDLPPEGSTRVDFAARAAEIKKFSPDAVLVIGFAESAQVIKALAAAGVQLRH